MKPIKIEKGIPVPGWGFAEDIRRALRCMEVGDSFGLEYGDKQIHIYDLAGQAGVRVKVRKMNGEGYRVWRIKENAPRSSNFKGGQNKTKI
jgi:hypothetical protein